MAESKQSSRGTVAILVIGDEILKGQTLDTNSHFLAQNCHRHGLRVKRISVVPDQIDVISEELRALAETYSLVLTSGGIGPTHDDVTYEAIAAAFQDELVLNPDIADFVANWFKTDDRTHPGFKLAQIPSKGKLNFGINPKTGNISRFPIVSINNVFVFPGIPQLLKLGFSGLTEVWKKYSGNRQFFDCCVYVNDVETNIAKKLNQLVSKHTEVSIGSYPKLQHSYYKVKLTLEAECEEALKKAEEDIRCSIDHIMEYDPEPEINTMDKIRNLLRNENCPDDFRKLLKESVDIINECLDRYPDSNELSVCFNGGKDCVAALHLFHAAFQERYPGKKLYNFYVKEPEPFSEVVKFLEESERRYNLDSMILEGSMKSSLATMLEKRSSVKAAVLGLRKGDPGAHTQSFFEPTDGDWPKMMRVNPILQWDYKHVWYFIRELNVPYPSLYDQGYTSLGCQGRTRKNPTLRYIDERGNESYKPAYELKDASQERAGRISKL